jgi:hypothetical protein
MEGEEEADDRLSIVRISPSLPFITARWPEERISVAARRRTDVAPTLMDESAVTE